MTSVKVTFEGKVASADIDSVLNFEKVMPENVISDRG